jgi:PhnB protein
VPGPWTRRSALLRDAPVSPSLRTRAEGLGELGMGAAAAAGGSGAGLLLAAGGFGLLGVVSPQTVGGTSTVLHLYTEDVDALWTRAVDAGAQALHPLQDQFWGDRHGQLTDPFGHR